MRVMIVRRTRGVSFSMDVYADGLIAGLKTVRPDWQIAEIAPNSWTKAGVDWKAGTGLRKYYERFWNHPRTVSRQNADIFHVIDHSNGHVAYGLHKAGKPVVITCHDLVQLVYPEILRDQARFPALSMATWRYAVGGMSVADRMIAVSSNTAADITSRLGIPADRVTVALNGIDAEFRVLEPEVVQSFRSQYCPADTLCLLNVGSTHQRKNFLTVLRVVSRLKAHGMPVCLWTVGATYSPEYQAFIQSHDLEANVIELGKLDKSKLVQAYNAADLLLAPSLYEGFGLTIVEAMACGTPVITSNVSSLPEVAGDAAVMIDPMDIDGIVDAVYQVQQDATHRQRLIERGVERAKVFTWEKMAEQVAQVYEQVYEQVKSVPAKQPKTARLSLTGTGD